MSAITAKPIEWQAHPGQHPANYAEWTESHYGFHITFDVEEQPRLTGSGGGLLRTSGPVSLRRQVARVPARRWPHCWRDDPHQGPHLCPAHVARLVVAGVVETEAALLLAEIERIDRAEARPLRAA